MVMGDMEIQVDLAVLGAGPAGLTAALRAAELGLETALIDPFPLPGGHYLHGRTVPAKLAERTATTLTRATQMAEQGIIFTPAAIDFDRHGKWIKQTLATMGNSMKELCNRRGILRVKGTASFESERQLRITGTDLSHMKFKAAVIATGREPVYPDGFTRSWSKRILCCPGAWFPTSLPKKLLIIGATAEGLELGTYYSSLGSKVSLVENHPTLLPEVDRELVEPLTENLNSIFHAISLHTEITEIKETDDGVEVKILSAEREATESFDQLIVMGSYIPAISGLGLEKAGVQTESSGAVITNAHQQSTMPHIYAVGTVTGHAQSFHRGAQEGRVAAEVFSGISSVFEAQAIPRIILTRPMIGWCGLTEFEAGQRGIAIYIKRCSGLELSIPLCTEAETSMVKLLAERDSGRIIGMGASGPYLEPLLAEGALAIEMGCLMEDIALTVHPHPCPSSIMPEVAAMFQP